MNEKEQQICKQMKTIIICLSILSFLGLMAIISYQYTLNINLIYTTTAFMNKLDLAVLFFSGLLCNNLLILASFLIIQNFYDEKKRSK